MDCCSSWVPTVDRFFCWSLGTGALVIGGLNLVLALGMLVYYGNMLVSTLAVEEGLLGQDFNEQFQIAFNKSGLTDSFENREHEFRLETACLVMDGIWVVVAGLYLVMASLLIHGARKERASLITYWLVLTDFTIIFDLVQLIFDIVSAYQHGIDWASVVVSIFVVCVGTYLWLVVWSYRKKLRERGSENIYRTDI